MPPKPPAPLAVVLADIGSTARLTLPYFVERVMPVVQQRRLTALNHRLSIATPRTLPQPTAATTTSRPDTLHQGAPEGHSTAVATATTATVQLHNMSLFAHSHVCAFAQRVPVLQHTSWQRAWTETMSDTAKVSRTTPGSAQEERLFLFGPAYNAASHACVDISELRASCTPSAVVLAAADTSPNAAGAASASTHVTELSVPRTFSMECFRVDAFMPLRIQVQEGARHVLRQLGPPAAASAAASFPLTHRAHDLATLAVVCPDHDVEAYVSFMDEQVARLSCRGARTQSTSTTSAVGNESGCTMLLFDTTHGLRYVCEVPSAR